MTAFAGDGRTRASASPTTSLCRARRARPARRRLARRAAGAAAAALPSCGSRSSRSLRGCSAPTRACPSSAAIVGFTCVPMNFTISGFFCCSAMKPARSVGCGSLGRLGVRHLELVLGGLLAVAGLAAHVRVVLLVDGDEQLLHLGSTVDFMYFFFGVLIHLLPVDLLAGGDGLRRDLGPSGFAASPWGLRLSGRGHRRRCWWRRCRSGRRARDSRREVSVMALLSS